MDIYRNIKIVNGRKAFFNNLEPVKISPKMKHIFDAMLATEDEINGRFKSLIEYKGNK